MPALPPSMVNMGWEYPAHLLQPDMAALTPAGATQPGNAQQQASGTAAVAAAANQGAAAVVRMSAAAANIIGQEQPCRVKLRLWRYSLTTPVQALDFAALTITDAVLCSEMGVHFSPCGRFMAACVACQDQLSSTAPQPQSLHLPASSAVPTPNIVYEVRIYSVEQCTFGKVLHARRIQAAHCLTSVQFSPSSEHLLLAYGRRHISLLRSLVAEGGTIIPVHTILEVYRVADMSLVRVLPTAEDEVNAAAFHPFEGGGIAYGTKEGRLRILRHDRAPQPHPASPSLRSLEDELLEADSVVHVGASSDDDA
ncbi:hypothetical protein WJX72_004148 [[Myrmecia] bisecta]|uniref:Uncharacterized protein n=1 Tax=[Myrmecia] bisecta TaxID=41462 RepID=A0AAW1P6C7_9CHLO